MEQASKPVNSMDTTFLLQQPSVENGLSSIENGVTGVEGKIADAFNDIVSLAERRARETARVSHMVGREGKLKQRMSVPGAVGGWADEISAINTLIDDFVFPTVEVTRAVGAVAKGDLGQSMALEVDGRPLW
jgi:hypothetical protein